MNIISLKLQHKSMCLVRISVLYNDLKKYTILNYFKLISYYQICYFLKLYILWWLNYWLHNLKIEFCSDVDMWLYLCNWIDHDRYCINKKKMVINVFLISQRKTVHNTWHYFFGGLKWSVVRNNIIEFEKLSLKA